MISTFSSTTTERRAWHDASFAHACPRRGCGGAIIRTSTCGHSCTLWFLKIGLAHLQPLTITCLPFLTRMPTTTHSLTHSVTRHNSYMIYTVWRPVGPPATSTHMSVERLNSKDFLSSALEATLFTGPDASADEAPVLLKRKGVYYAMFGHGCCFCEGGSGVNVFTSSHPLGPYQGGPAPSPCVVNKQSTCYFCLE